MWAEPHRTACRPPPAAKAGEGKTVATTEVPPRNADSAPSQGGAGSFWKRQLPHYPENGPRSLYLAITVLATVVLYYELYIPGAVATQIIADYNISFTG